MLATELVHVDLTLANIEVILAALILSGAAQTEQGAELVRELSGKGDQ